jgi:predicted NAD/FAD-binding protein
MKIAVVGSGISGLMAAYLLSRQHEVDVFEKNDYVGGHSNTVTTPNGTPVDTGFIVFNEANYPHFSRLLQELGVASQPSDMSFGVDDPATGFAFSSRGLAGLLARPSNLLRPSFYRFVKDIHRFNQAALWALNSDGCEGQTLGEFVASQNLSDDFLEHYLIPMSSAIWSAPPGKTLNFAASVFLRFFKNHGLLSLSPSIKWRTVCGGSRAYVQAISKPFADRIHLNCAVRQVRREGEQVRLSVEGGADRFYDRVVLAAHADQALAMLADATDEERRLLGYYPYQGNRVVLHSDTSVMPKARGAWASWTVRVTPTNEAPLVMSYDMNRLQSLPPEVPYFVTLNPEQSWRAPTYYDVEYEHPAYGEESFPRQPELRQLNGTSAIYFCGAYFGYGFHEDGLVSGLEVARALGVEWA